MDNGDDFDGSGATAKTNIVIPPTPPPPLTEHYLDIYDENDQVDIYKIDCFDSDYFDLGCDDDDVNNDEHYIGRKEAMVNAIPPQPPPFDDNNHAKKIVCGSVGSDEDS